MEAYVRRKFNGLYGLYDSDEEIIKRIPQGTDAKIKITLPRNLDFHKKFFALVNLAYQNQPEGEFKVTEFENFRSLLIMKAGHYKRVVTQKGEFYLPKSISFANMDELNFQILFNDVLDVVCKLIDTTQDEIMDELETFF